MSENMNVYEKVRNVPPAALKEIKGGRLKGMSDINPMWRIKMLTEVFGMCGIGWKIEIVNKKLEPGGNNETVCFVDINLFVKVDGAWSEAIPGMGGSSFVTEEKGGLYTSDECFKMAYTDAIGVACKSLGFAADVYFANDRTKHSNQEQQESPKQGPQIVPQGQAHNPSGNRTQSSTSQYEKPHSFKIEAYKLREAHFMGWDDLQKVAERVLGRKLTKVTQLQDEKEWEMIVNDIKSYNRGA